MIGAAHLARPITQMVLRAGTRRSSASTSEPLGGGMAWRYYVSELRGLSVRCRRTLIDTSHKWKISSRSVKTSGPRLTPFVRSDAVGVILAETLGHPDREFSLAELGRRTGVSGPVVHREVGRLVESDILRDRHEGRNRLVRANAEHPLFGPMGEIIDATYGPVPVLRELFEGVDGTERVLIYGSWAARRAGEGGAFPNDIDVLVVGSSPRRELTAIASEASTRLDLTVNVTRLSVDEWAASEPAPFVATLRTRPTVDVMSGDVDA